MQSYWLVPWAPPPGDLNVACPPPPPGEVAVPFGAFDPQSVAAAYAAAGSVNIVTVLLLVFACYLLASGSTSPRFSRRWSVFLGLSVAISSLATLLVLRLWPAHALAGTCQTNPAPFAQTLPWDAIILRSIAGLYWGALLFLLFSLLLTRLAGRWPSAGGFFHYRGTPWPRFAPFRD